MNKRLKRYQLICENKSTCSLTVAENCTLLSVLGQFDNACPVLSCGQNRIIPFNISILDDSTSKNNITYEFLVIMDSSNNVNIPDEYTYLATSHNTYYLGIHTGDGTYYYDVFYKKIS